MITINKMEEMQKYYDANSDTYVFDDHVTFKCDISVASHIHALDIEANDIKALEIHARNIKAMDIIANLIDALNVQAWDINAYNIIAHAISYHAVCFAYKNITCKSIKGRRVNCTHFVLDGEIKEEKK